MESTVVRTTGGSAESPMHEGSIAAPVCMAPAGRAGRIAWLFTAILVTLVFRADGRGPQRSAANRRPNGSAGPAAEARRGSLVICGGGGLPESVRKEFVRLAGSPKAKIVVIPTASEDVSKLAGRDGVAARKPARGMTTA
jgi:hypothetical protein